MKHRYAWTLFAVLAGAAAAGCEARPHHASGPVEANRSPVPATDPEPPLALEHRTWPQPYRTGWVARPDGGPTAAP